RPSSPSDPPALTAAAESRAAPTPAPGTRCWAPRSRGSRSRLAAPTAVASPTVPRRWRRARRVDGLVRPAAARTAGYDQCRPGGPQRPVRPAARPGAGAAVPRRREETLPCAPWDAVGMVRFGSVVMKVGDIGRAAEFWSRALGYAPSPGNPAFLRPEGGEGPGLHLDEDDR